MFPATPDNNRPSQPDSQAQEKDYSTLKFIIVVLILLLFGYWAYIQDQKNASGG
jgi:hypothetical protein